MPLGELLGVPSGDGALLDAAMTSLDARMDPPCLGHARVGKPQGRIFMQTALISFQRQHVVTAALDDGADNPGLSSPWHQW